MRAEVQLPPADASRSTLLHLLQERAHATPEGDAATHKVGGAWVHTSWASILSQVRSLSAALVARGIQPGDRVSVFADSSLRWCIADLAICATRAITVPIYASNTPDEVKYVLQHSGAVLAFVDHDKSAGKQVGRLTRLRSVLGQVPAVRQVVVMEEGAKGAEQTLEAVGLRRSYTRRFPHEFSGGQRQRVAVARALALEPAVLLFDEPLSNLDARLRRQMREEIRDLQQRLGLTVVYVTHDQSEALAVSDRIIVMDKAVIAQEGAPRELYAQPKDAFVAGFMGEANRVRGTLRRRDAAEGDVALGPLTIALPHRGLADGDIDVAIRPEAIRLEPAGASPLKGVVRKAAYLGHTMEYTADTAIGPLFVIDTGVDRPLAVGTDVAVAFAPHGVIAIPAA